MNKPEAELSGYQKERIIPIEFQNDQYEFKIFFCFTIFKFSA